MTISIAHQCWGIKCGTAHKPLSRCLAHDKCSHMSVLGINLMTLPLSTSQAPMHVSRLRPHVFKNVLSCFPPSTPPSVLHCAPSITWGYLYFSPYFIAVFCLPSEDWTSWGQVLCFVHPWIHRASVLSLLAFSARELRMRGYGMSVSSFMGNKDVYSQIGRLPGRCYFLVGWMEVINFQVSRGKVYFSSWALTSMRSGGMVWMFVLIHVMKS